MINIAFVGTNSNYEANKLLNHYFSNNKSFSITKNTINPLILYNGKISSSFEGLMVYRLLNSRYRADMGMYKKIVPSQVLSMFLNQMYEKAEHCILYVSNYKSDIIEDLYLHFNHYKAKHINPENLKSKFLISFTDELSKENSESIENWAKHNEFEIFNVKNDDFLTHSQILSQIFMKIAKNASIL